MNVATKTTTSNAADGPTLEMAPGGGEAHGKMRADNA
jgi:hypothetical protein